MYSPDSAFTGRLPVVGPYPARMTRTRNYEFDFMSCFSKHISDYEKAGRKGSAANYRSSYRLLLSFLDGQHLTSQHLSARWVERYERWLRARGVTTNTVTFHLRNLRAVYNRSVKKRFIPASFPNPFFHLTVRQTVTRKRALSRETIKRICTGQMLSMRIEPQLQHIIDRYSNASPYILPILAKDDSYDNYRQQQRELNKFIRKIGVLLNIPEPLTFYVARHSWATLARDCGTPLTVISAGMGHTSERTTRIYLAQLDHNIIDKANRKIIDLQ